MRRQLLDTAVAQTITWTWLGFLAAVVVTWFACRYWRRRNPPPPPVPERSYSQHLQQRLAQRRVAAKLKQRVGPAKRNQGRHR